MLETPLGKALLSGNPPAAASQISHNSATGGSVSGLRRRHAERGVPGKRYCRQLRSFRI
jgi:hypothetical protein